MEDEKTFAGPTGSRWITPLLRERGRRGPPVWVRHEAVWPPDDAVKQPGEERTRIRRSTKYQADSSDRRSS